MKTMTRRVRAVLADDHQIVLEGLRELLQKRFDVVGCAANGEELVALAQEYKPDVVVVDITMPGLDGIEAVGQIRSSGFHPKAVFLTTLEDPKLVLRAFQVGGEHVGYVLKFSACTELVTAIQEVMEGRSYLTPRITGGVLQECVRRSEQLPEGLTGRQVEVLRLISQGKTMKEVASGLEISTRTAEAHKYAMMQQLGIKSCAQLIHFAIREGIVPRTTASNGQEQLSLSPRP
jgi:DNA-binding NarL/FixJ family response regulator